MIRRPTFKIGDYVEKYTGKHRYKGRVTALWLTRAMVYNYRIQIARGTAVETDGFEWRLNPNNKEQTS